MPRKYKRPAGSSTYQEALRTIVEEGFYVIQRRRLPADPALPHGQWRTVSQEVQGKARAVEQLDFRKERHPEYEWRCVQTVVAEAYAEGWKSHEDFLEAKKEALFPSLEETPSDCSS